MKSINKWQVEFGELSKEELLVLLTKNKICLNGYAVMLFLDEKFTTSSSQRIAHLVEMSVANLGFKIGAQYCDIVEAAKNLGLQMCPLELGPYFRVQFLNQSEGPYLTLASKKTRKGESYPNGIYLRHSNELLWLRGYCSTSDWLWSPEDKFVFVEGYA